MNKRTISELVTLIIAMTVFVISDIFFKITELGFFYMNTNGMIFTVLISIIVYTLIFAISKKSSRATKICYGLIFILNVVNFVKIAYTGEPIYFSDIKFIFQIGSLSELALSNVSSSLLLKSIGIFFIYAIILVGIAFISKKNELEIKSKKVRISVIIIYMVLLLFLFIPSKYTKELYLRLFTGNDNYKDYSANTEILTYYESLTLVAGMYGNLLNSEFYEPDNYNEEELDELLEDIKDLGNDGLQASNIIIVFSESFMDFSNLEEVEFNVNITQNFDNLKSEGVFVNLLTPTYGGLSENVVFEVLTGGSMNYFTSGYIPVMSLYSRSNSQNIPSLIKVLKENGYYSKIVFGRDYYNSSDAYAAMGFDEYFELYDGQTSITDEYLTDYIINDLETKEDGELYIGVYSTYEAHMPYGIDKYENYDVEIKKSNLSDSAVETLTAYAQAIYNADKQLLRLYEYICQYDEPTMLIFLGDHLPYLYTTNGSNALDELEYFNTDDELTNLYRKYNTQALVLANYDLDELEVNSTLGTNVFFNYIISNMDVDNEKYYEWLYSSTLELPASNKYISIDNENNLYYTSELEDNMLNIYNLRELMQYKFFLKN